MYNDYELFAASEGVEMIHSRDIKDVASGKSGAFNYLEVLFTSVSAQKMSLDMRSNRLKPTDADTGAPIDTSSMLPTKTSVVVFVAGDNPESSGDSGAISALQKLRDQILIDFHIIGIGANHPASLYDWYSRLSTTMGTYSCAAIGYDVTNPLNTFPESGYVEVASGLSRVRKVLEMMPLPAKYKVTSLPIPMNLTVDRNGYGRTIVVGENITIADKRLQVTYQEDPQAARFAVVTGCRFILNNIEEFEREGADTTYIVGRIESVAGKYPDLRHTLCKLLRAAPKGGMMTRDYCAACNAVLSELLTTL